MDGKPTIVFVNTRAHCDQVTRALEHSGHACAVLHGGKAQDAREVSLEGFKSGKYNVLVATDVAGRGIDVQDVALVVNYDMPNTIEAYTHRIGRTGRAGKKVPTHNARCALYSNHVLYSADVTSLPSFSL
jgi:ATP-dependent RNA helicase DDX23/PRP28